jgi:stage V sporulation protein B
MKKQSLIKGTFILGIAGIAAKFLGFFFRWPLIMLIGDEGIGYYQMSYPLYTFFIAIASGIPVAVSKMVSEKVAVGDKDGSIVVLKKAIMLMFILGGGFTAVLLAFSHQLIDFFKWDHRAYYSLVGISAAPVVISIMSAFRGFFQGLQNMYPTAVSQIIEQFGRVCVGVGLAFILLPRGIEYSAGGAAFGAAAGGTLAGIYLISKYLKVRKEFKVRKSGEDRVILTKLLYTAIPISLGATVGTIMSLIDSILVPQKLLQAGFNYTEATTLYGQLTGKAFVLVSVPLTLSMALCTSLVPMIAEAHLLNRRGELVSKVDMAMRLSMVIAIPSAMGLYFMAMPILNLVFPGHAAGYKILQYLALSIPFIVLAQTSTAIMQGMGKYITPVINLGIGCFVKVIINFILVPVPGINVYGAVIGSICGYIIAAALNIWMMKKTLKLSMDYFDVIVKPILASSLMIISVVFIYMNVYNYTVSNAISCIVSVVVAALVYGVLILVLGVFKYSYIKKRFLRK